MIQQEVIDAHLLLRIPNAKEDLGCTEGSKRRSSAVVLPVDLADLTTSASGRRRRAGDLV